MKKLLAGIFIMASLSSIAQTRVFPIVKNFGGIFEVPDAAEKPDPEMKYNIVIEVERESDRPDTINWALNNVARLMNLHVMAGVKPENLNVIIAIHGPATYTVMENRAYRAKYKVDNPNLAIYQELEKAGVKMVVCGQSLVNRKVDRTRMVPQVKIASSMLTTLTTYQLKGFAMLKF